jgi:hypothetical protein
MMQGMSAEPVIQDDDRIRLPRADGRLTGTPLTIADHRRVA